MFDEYGEVINSEITYKTIAKDLVERGSCIVGWTDKEYDHRDILFTFRPRKYGNLQRGLRCTYLFVSIMDHSSMGFLIEDGNCDNVKHSSYIKEKLRLNDNNCDDKICELINGIIHEIDVLRINK